MAKLVSKTYGDALFELAMEDNRIDSYVEEVEAVMVAVNDNPELSKLMNHPKVVKEEKMQIMENIFSEKISREVLGLIRMLVAKGHYNEMQDVFAYFIHEVKEYKNIGTAYVTAAMELSKTQQKQIEEKLLETTKYVQFEMNYSVDQSLIGGMVIRIGDRVVDSSVRTKIYKLSKELSKIQLKVGECAP